MSPGELLKLAEEIERACKAPNYEAHLGTIEGKMVVAILRQAASQGRCEVCGSGDFMTICEGCWNKKSGLPVHHAASHGAEIKRLRAQVEYWRLAAERREARMERSGVDVAEASTLDAPSVPSAHQSPPVFKATQQAESDPVVRPDCAGGDTGPMFECPECGGDLAEEGHQPSCTGSWSLPSTHRASPIDDSRNPNHFSPTREGK